MGTGSVNHQKPAPEKVEKSKPDVYVTAHLDGKALNIGGWVLDGARQLGKAAKSAKGKLGGTIQTERGSPWVSMAFGAALAVPALAIGALAVGTAVAGAGIGAAASIAAWAAAPALLAANPILKAFADHRLRNDQSLELKSSETRASTEKEPVERLRQNLIQNMEEYPNSTQVCYLSGHGGDGKKLAGIPLTDLKDRLAETQSDITILDACSSCSLEVMANLAPWAGLAVASSHVVPMIGYDIQNVFGQDQLQASSTEEMAVQMAKAAEGRTFSLNVVDTTVVGDKLLPSLSKLGASLEKELKSERGEHIKKALRKSRNVGLLNFGSQKDLGSFLDKLEEVELSELSEGALAETRDALASAMKYQKNDSGLFFSRRGHDSLPKEWNSFLKATKR